MQRDRRLTSLVARWARRRASLREEDPADLGTAFGLDLSLSMPAEAPAAVAPPRSPRTGWWTRWRSRAG